MDYKSSQLSSQSHNSNLTFQLSFVTSDIHYETTQNQYQPLLHSLTFMALDSPTKAGFGARDDAIKFTVGKIDAGVVMEH
jgi:hypothetical protein